MRQRTEKMLDGVTATGAGSWFKLPADKVISVEGITTATVEIEYRTNEDHTPISIHSFTSDGCQANSDSLYQVRLNVTAYTSGTIDGYASFAY